MASTHRQSLGVTSLESDSNPASNRRGFALVLVLLVTIGFALRLYRLTHQSLWVDEIVTYLSSRGTLNYVLWQTDVNSNIPPLYYVVVHLALWLQRDCGLGDQDAAMRLPSVLFGAATIPFTFLALRELIGRSAALYAAALTTISPFLIWYSQEARPYALLLLLSLTAVWCWQRAMANSTSLVWRAAAAVSAAAIVYCHTVGVGFMVFLIGWALLMAPRREWPSWIATIAATGLLLLPVAWRLYSLPPVASANDEYAFNPLHLVYTVWTFFTGYSLGPSVSDLHLPDKAAIVLRYAPLIVPTLVILSLVCLTGARELRRVDRTSFKVILAWLLCPLTFAVVGSLLTVHPFNVRYAILAFPPVVAVSALGIETARRRWFRMAALAGFVLISGMSLVGYFQIDRFSREDNRGAGRFVAQHATDGDLVIANAPYTADALEYYAREAATMVVGYPSGKQQFDASKLAADLTTLVGARQRFWLFLSRTFSSDVHDDLIHYCDSHFRTRLTFVGNGVRLILYERSP